MLSQIETDEDDHRRTSSSAARAAMNAALRFLDVVGDHPSTPASKIHHRG